MEWQSVAQGLFGFMALAIAGWIAKSIDTMKEDLSELNCKIAVIIERIESHDKRISKLEDQK